MSDDQRSREGRRCTHVSHLGILGNGGWEAGCGAQGKTKRWEEKRAQDWTLKPHVSLEDGVKYCGVGGGREMSLEAVSKNEGICREKERRGL